jgi:hypothetical protein
MPIHLLEPQHVAVKRGASSTEPTKRDAAVRGSRTLDVERADAHDDNVASSVHPFARLNGRSTSSGLTTSRERARYTRPVAATFPSCNGSGAL